SGGTNGRVAPFAARRNRSGNRDERSGQDDGSGSRRKEEAGGDDRRGTPFRVPAAYALSGPLPSLVASLKFRIPLPMPRPISGSRLAPKIRITITRTIISSGRPSLGINHSFSLTRCTCCAVIRTPVVPEPD